MPNEPSDGASPAPGGEVWQHTFTPEQDKRLTAVFTEITAVTTLAFESQLEIFEPEDEAYIRREVDRMLYEPKLPNGGDKERHIIERMKALARKQGQGWDGYQRLHYAISQWQAVLPDDPRNAGMYYIRHPISRKEDKAGFDYYRAMKLAASHAQHEELEWFADLMLKGTPEPVSNFAMECLFLLRKSNGDVDRLVRLKNVLGEVSHGTSHKGSDLLVGEAFGGPEKFRIWTLKRGNFSWSGNQIALQALHMDNTSAGAWRVINQVEFAGAMEVKRRAAKVAATGEPVKESSLPRGWKMRDTLWFYGDCVYAEGKVLQADDDGIYWYEGEGYYPTVMGREAEFAQGKPKLRPNEGLYRKALIAGEQQAYELRLGRPKDEAEVTREFFLAVVKAAYETVGGYDGWLAIGMMLAYAAGPEIFAKYALFPGHWVHGQAASGKTLWCEWLMHLLGFNISSGIGLLATTTTVGLQQQLENYSSLALWADEYRQGTIKEEKEALLRDAYNRQQSVKWTSDGKPRTMRTAFIVSGESTASDAALRSRYAHVQISRAKRLVEHREWMQENKPCFLVFWRLLMERREEFVAVLARYLESWLGQPGIKGMDEREKMVHGIGYAAFAAANYLIEGVGADEVVEFRKHVLAHAKVMAAEVSSETNINVFLTDFLTAFKANAVSLDCFRLEFGLVDHPPGWPNQGGGWRSYKLFVDPERTVSAINQHLRKEGRVLSLTAKDLQAQLSKTEYWVENAPPKRIGPKGSRVVTRCWGFQLDKMPQGRVDCTDEAFRAYKTLRISTEGEDADPRLGPFYAIVAAIEAADRESIREEKANGG